jgi:hypothetical protein
MTAVNPFVADRYRRMDTMDYESISDEDVRRLLRQTAPDLEIGEITDSNRETVVAFLRFFLLMTT